jgi:hypothetical protein
MSVNSALDRLRESNPVPHVATIHDDSRDFDALLHASIHRSTALRTLDPGHRSSEPSTGRAGWIVALAAAAVFVTIGAVLLLAPGGSSDVADETPPTTQILPPTTAATPITTQALPPTTSAASPTTWVQHEGGFSSGSEAIAGYLEALNSGDLAAYNYMMFPGAEDGAPMFASEGKPADVMAFRVERGNHYTLSECDTNTSERAVCEIVQDAGETVPFLGPVPATFTIELAPDGRIQFVKLQFHRDTTAISEYTQCRRANYAALDEEIGLQVFGPERIIRPIAQLVAEDIAAEQDCFSQILD